MGLTHITAKVTQLTKQGIPFAGEFLVDTGSTDSMAPAESLLAAGIVPEQKSVCELANGQPVEYELGFARISFMGEETVTPIIFGPAHSEPILGVVALESVGVVVDPVTKTLKRLPAKPLKQRKRA